MGHASLPIDYVTYANELDPDPQYVETTWGELVSELTQHDLTDCDPCPGGKKCRAKFGMALSPGIPREGTTRSDASTGKVGFLMLDFDHLTQKEAEGVDERTEGLELVAHSTHSHRHGLPADEAAGTPARPPEEDLCFRIAFPYPRPLTPAEHKKVRAAFIEKYRLEWRRPDGSKAGADPARKDLSGIYFFPSAPKSQKDNLIAVHQEGTLVEVDELLAAAPAAMTASAAVTAVSAPLPVTPTGPVDMEAIRRALRAYNPRKRPEDEGEVISKKELAGRVARGEALVKSTEPGQRDHSCNRIGFILGRKFADLIPDEATLLALVDMPVRLMPTYPDDDPEKDSLESRFAKVFRGYANGHAAHEAQVKERAERKAERKAEHKSLYTGGIAERLNRHKQASTGEVEANDCEDDEGDEDGRFDADGNETAEWVETNWEKKRKLLLRAPDREDGSEGALLKGGANAALILEHEPRWRGCIRFNEVTKDVVIGDAPIREYEKSVASVTNGINNWLQIEFGLILTSTVARDQIYHVARANSFDPLKDYLNGVRHDRTKRIDTFLEVYCGAETEDEEGNDITEYLRKISRRFLMGAAARGLKPGCQMDNVLILEGEQGVKKSRFLRALGGEFFADSTMNVTDKDSKMLVSQHWIIELAELSSLRPNETEAQKGFFSSPVDKFRPPYAHAVEKFPRRCVCVGTTNDYKYMYDPTGARRPWPVRCRALDARRVKKDRDLIWAEAVAEYKAGFTCPDCLASNDGDTSKEEDRCEKHRWWLTLEENKKYLEGQNNQRIRSGFAGVLKSWLLAFKPELRPTELTTTVIALEALSIPPDRIESHFKAIGLAAAALKMEHKQRMVNGKREWMYVVPEEMRTAPILTGVESSELPPKLKLVPKEGKK